MVVFITLVSQGKEKIYLIKTKDAGLTQYYKSELGEANETNTVAIHPFNEEDLDRNDVPGQDQGTEILFSGANSFLSSLLPDLAKEKLNGASCTKRLKGIKGCKEIKWFGLFLF